MLSRGLSKGGEESLDFIDATRGQGGVKVHHEEQRGVEEGCADGQASGRWLCTWRCVQAGISFGNAYIRALG